MPVKFMRRSDGTVGTIPQDIYIPVHAVGATEAIDRVVFIADTPMKFVGVSLTFSTTSTSGTLQIEKCPVGTAPGSGTDLLASAMSLSGTANVNVVGTPIADGAARVFAAGDRCAFDFSGTVTGLKDLQVTLRFQRLQVATAGTY
jgi:hypothetical protein